MTQSRNLIRKRWAPDWVALELVRRNFADSRTADLAEVLGVSYHQVSKLAERLELKKDAAFLNGPVGGRTDGIKGMGTRFQKGQKGWNAGKKMGPDWCKATQFKPGQKPPNYAPIGALRVTTQGWLQIKMTDTGYSPSDWVMYHRHVWEQAHGPVPDGHVIAFRDPGPRTDPATITLDRLECITKSVLMLRHSVQRYGPEMASVMQLRGALSRQIKRAQERAEEHS